LEEHQESYESLILGAVVNEPTVGYSSYQRTAAPRLPSKTLQHSRYSHHMSGDHVSKSSQLVISNNLSLNIIWQ